VIVTDANGCRDTSAVYEATGVGLREITNDELRMTIYPNPNNGNFTLEFSDNKMREVMITDVFGKILLTETAVQGKKEFALNDHPAGLYFIRVTGKGHPAVLKL